MRKGLLLAALAAIALTANAQDIEPNNELQEIKSNCIATDAAVWNNTGLHLNDEDTASLAGTYVFKTTSTYNENYSRLITIAQAEDGSYSITGLMLGIANENAVNATYADGTLTVPAGQVNYVSSTYGDATLSLVTKTAGDTLYYDKSSDIVFTADENGKFTLSNGVGLLLALSGTYEGSYLSPAYVDGYDFAPANGTMTNYRVTSRWAATDTTTFTTTVEYGDGKGVVGGIDGLGWASFTYDDSNTVTFTQEDSLYYYSSSYTLLVMTKAGTTSSGTYGTFSGKAPDGTIDFEAGTITLNPWCLTMTSLSTGKATIINGRKNQSIITFPPVESGAISDVAVESTTTGKARKYISEGQFIIEKDGVKYNRAGQTVD